MASINGISVKNLKQFAGHDGDGYFQGNLYIENKKIGFWSQDAWCGPDEISLEPAYSLEKLNGRLEELNPDKTIHGVSYDNKAYTIPYNFELLMGDLISLSDEEKDFKRAVKQGFSGILVVTDDYHAITWKLKEEFTQLSNEVLLSRLSKMIENNVENAGFYKNKERKTKVYRSLEDFQIGTPITLMDISKENSLDGKIEKISKEVTPSTKQKSTEKER